jgi:hypothetical protein
VGSIPASRAKQFPFSHLFIQKAGTASESCAGFFMRLPLELCKLFSY